MTETDTETHSHDEAAERLARNYALFLNFYRARDGDDADLDDALRQARTTLRMTVQALLEREDPTASEQGELDLERLRIEIGSRLDRLRDGNRAEEISAGDDC